MSVAALMMVRDEADIIEHTIAHLNEQVDAVYVRDQGSTDGTLEILMGCECQVSRLDDPAYYQSRIMSEMADEARQDGHGWVLPCDADEWWYSPFGRVADILGPVDSEIVRGELYDHVATGADNGDPNPFKRLTYRRREAARLPKVAARALPGLVIEQGNHGARYPGEHVRSVEGLVARHFPYRSLEQMIRKVRNGAAAYAATNLPPSVGAHWRQYGEFLERVGPSAIEEIFTTWFYVGDPVSDRALILDPVEAI